MRISTFFAHQFHQRQKNDDLFLYRKKKQGVHPQRPEATKGFKLQQT